MGSSPHLLGSRAPYSVSSRDEQALPTPVTSCSPCHALSLGTPLTGPTLNPGRVLGDSNIHMGSSAFLLLVPHLHGLYPPLHSVTQDTYYPKPLHVQTLSHGSWAQCRPGGTRIQLLGPGLPCSLWVPASSPPVLLLSCLQKLQATSAQQDIYNSLSAASIWQNATMTQARFLFLQSVMWQDEGIITRSSAPSRGP